MIQGHMDQQVKFDIEVFSARATEAAFHHMSFPPRVLRVTLRASLARAREDFHVRPVFQVERDIHFQKPATDCVDPTRRTAANTQKCF